MIWSSWAEPVPPILAVPFFSLTMARYSLAVLAGVSAFTHRMKRSRARRATGVRSFQENGTPVWSGVVNRFESVMMIVWASPFLPLTCRKPSAPAPPALFTTTMGRGVSLCFSATPAMSRAIWSAPPPVPAGMTNSIGLVGSQARAGNDVASNTTIGRTRTRRRCLIGCLLTASCGDETRRGRTPFRARPRLMVTRTSPALLRLLDAQGGPGGVEPLERHDPGDLPLVPRLVDLGLEVGQILLGEVREVPLLEQVLADRLAGPTLDDRLRLAVILQHAVLDLVEREDAGLDGQL